MIIFIALVVLVIHIALLVFLRLYASTKVYFGNINLIWAAAIPIFGPLAGIIIVLGSSKERDYDELYRITNGVTNEEYDYRRMEGDYLSAEEVLKINDSAERRKTMLEILRQDPLKYTEILKIASINEDVDTAHYATTSMMELQSNFQKSIMKYGTIASRSDASMQDYINYVEVLVEFLNSRIMDENLVRRQRMYLKGEIETLFEKYDCYKYEVEYIENLIMLGDYATAIDFCEMQLRDKNQREEIYLLRIKLYIIQKDYDGLRKFTKKLENGELTLSPKLKEEVAFWVDDNNIIEADNNLY